MSTFAVLSLLVLHACRIAAVASDPGALTCQSGQGSACGNVLLQQSSSKSMRNSGLEMREDEVCDESVWPDKDHDLVCGECKVLVDRFNSFYNTCAGYCSAVGRSCVGAWEEQNDDCNVAYSMTCDQTIASSDAICQCGARVGGGSGSSDGGEGAEEGGCYGEFDQRAAEEGNGIGIDEIRAQDAGDCKNVCDGNDQCRSFTYCPEWGKCWLKDRSFNGGEATTSARSCKTFYKKACGTQPAPTPPADGSAPTSAPTSASTSRPVIKVVSYNLFWWNAYDQNRWKFDSIARNIQHVLQADTLGLQECDSADVVRDETGYTAASPFEGAQGVVVRPGVFSVGRSGSADIRATGRWGPRYVTWAEFTHLASGRTFWHFNTHWCVHNGNGHTCDSNKRFEGAKNMLGVIRQEAGTAPVVITGDFNAGMGEPGPQHFLENGFRLAKSHWVDAIFYSADHWDVVSASEGDSANSDHKPVIAELRLK